MDFSVPVDSLSYIYRSVIDTLSEVLCLWETRLRIDSLSYICRSVIDTLSEVLCLWETRLRIESVCGYVDLYFLGEVSNAPMQWQEN